VNEIDDFEGTPGIVVIATTNRADVLDSADTRRPSPEIHKRIGVAEAREESFHTHY
jgi:AAA+ superfamily predicted ATPase